QAIDRLDAALANAEQMDEQAEQASVLAQLAEVYLEVGDLASAVDYERRASTIATALQQRKITARLLCLRAVIEQTQGHHRAALAAYQQASELFVLIRNPEQELHC